MHFIPYLSILVWHKYCSYVFEASENSAHAMTFKILRLLWGKNPEMVIEIGKKLLGFSITYADVLWILVGFIISGVLFYLIKKAEIRTFVRLLLLVASMYVLYQIGTFGMYIFSMRGVDATELSSVSRYTKIILIASLYILSSIHIMLLDAKKFI